MKNATQTLNDARVNNGDHNTRKKRIPEHAKALMYLYLKSIKGIGVTNYSYAHHIDGNHYFRNHFDKRGKYELLKVIKTPEKYMSKSYLRYSLHPKEYENVRNILSQYFENLPFPPLITH